MFDFLLNHAIKNVWCTPGQDKQSIVKPARLTPMWGVMNRCTVMWRTLTLPVLNKRFHVYQIGQIYSYLIGLLPVVEEWTPLANICKQQNLIVDIYADSGVQLPRFETWYYITREKDIIIAVKEQPSIPVDLTTEDIYLRVYSNAYYNSNLFNPETDYIDVFGKTVTSNDDILELQNQFNADQQLVGQTYAFVNGFKVSGIDLFTTHIGDVVEVVYDSSIYKVVDFPIANLPSFVSTLDNKHKYLLHYTGSDHSTIDYQDDIDVFILKPMPNNRSVGVYYHRNEDDAMRMLTHRDYSIVVPYVVGYAQDQNWTDPTQLVVRLHIRKSGYNRPLIFEANRIKELYKLNDAEIVQAMVGTNSTVPNWQATTLEASSYTKIMRDNINSISRSEIVAGYGYNSISKLIGDTPAFTYTKNNRIVSDVPYSQIVQGIAYEYDLNGLLLGWYDQWSSTTYICTNPNAILVESICGTFGTTPEEAYGATTVTLDPTHDYRMYTSPIVNNAVTNEWVDVTGSSKYAIQNNTLTWLIDRQAEYTLVRGNGVVLTYGIRIPVISGVLKFTLEHYQSFTGVPALQPMKVPMGELDIFMNGRSLIENLDYYVKFPEVVIVNKEYLINPDTDNQSIAIRFSGFCNTDLSRTLPTDVGFIDHSILSNNNRFDIRDDKVLRITVDGKCYDRSQLKFSETDPGVMVPGVMDGRPYQIRDIIVPVGIATFTGDTYEIRSIAQVTDKAVSDYLTSRLPDQTFPMPTPIPQRYQLYSPFCANILYDLKNNVLDDPRIKTFYTDNDVADICKPYEYLLPFDPVINGILPDNNWVEVHPHDLDTTIVIDIYGYKFITRVLDIYFKNNINLSHFVQVA
jgi:hypothetical protein